MALLSCSVPLASTSDPFRSFIRHVGGGHLNFPPDLNSEAPRGAGRPRLHQRPRLRQLRSAPPTGPAIAGAPRRAWLSSHPRTLSVPGLPVVVQGKPGGRKGLQRHPAGRPPQQAESVRPGGAATLARSPFGLSSTPPILPPWRRVRGLLSRGSLRSSSAPPTTLGPAPRSRGSGSLSHSPTSHGQ